MKGIHLILSTNYPIKKIKQVKIEGCPHGREIPDSMDA